MVLIGLFIIFLPALLLAAIVWLLTGSIFWAGIVFLVVAVFPCSRKLGPNKPRYKTPSLNIRKG
jgi:hypothetical protein